jgi:hypothetical protein
LERYAAGTLTIGLVEGRGEDLLNGKVTRVPYREHMPPDITAQIFWLKNRDPAHWRDVMTNEPRRVRALLSVEQVNVDADQ